jgi:signal transduction histidine kinase
VTTFDWIAAALYLVPALVWAIMARQLWAYRRVARSRSALLRLAPFALTLVAVHMFLHVTWALTPSAMRDDPLVPVPPLAVLLEISALAMLAVGRHVFHLMPIPETPPGRAWLAVNYVPALLAGGFFTAVLLAPGSTPGEHRLISTLLHLAFVPLGALCLWEVVKIARPGAWGPESAAEVRQADIVLIAWGFVAAGLSLVVATLLGHSNVGMVLFEAGGGLAVAAPWTLRMLGVVIPEFFATATLLVVTGGILAAHAYASELVPPHFHPILGFATILSLVFLLDPVRTWLHGWTHRLVFRRSLQQQVELQAFLHTLSPDLGVHECCRRALAEIVAVRQLGGAAIILRDGEALLHGTFNVAPLLRVWPRGAESDALPERSFGTVEIRELPLPLREALLEANVGLGSAPIVSPRRRWGHLFLNTGLFGGFFREDDAEAFRGFVAQLALVLDGADLLARAVAVERSLAHAEKLAAIGELAARIAHEIRNPVTAARSLAQQLAREADSPFVAEHVLILAELERVERQVAALLRFARRDEFRFEVVDVTALVGATAEHFRTRAETAGVGLALRLDAALMARADAEKLRQVLVNLIENAIEALAANPNGKHLAIDAAAADGAIVVRVCDDGPGLPPEAMPHLFEPFFSTKATGTGLGLAIARRTVEAHGGRIAAEPGPDAGMTFVVSLPLASGV